MSQKERDRVVVLHQVSEDQISLSEGARRMGLGVRQMRRVVRRFEAAGDASVIHGLRGRRSNSALEACVRESALALARDPLYRDFGPTLLSEYMAKDPAIGRVHPATLRLWMVAAGLWSPVRQGKRHRKRRERRAAYGELVLMDTSIHRWLEDRSDEEIVLIALIDDATSRLHARFFRRDTGAANRQALVDYLNAHGRMGALYTDRASHFEAHFRAGARKAKDEPRAITLIRRAVEGLGIKLILALSPQAKGRVERLFKTLQDRLVKGLRIAGINSLDEANRYLAEVFLPAWETRFTVEPREAADAHRPLPEDVDLLRIFAETDERVIRADFTFRFCNQHFQIEQPDAETRMPGTRVTIEQRLDGTVRYRWRDTDLTPTVLPAWPLRRPVSVCSAPAVAPPAPRPPASKAIPHDHPWRRNPIIVGVRSRSPMALGSSLQLVVPPTPVTSTTPP
jgi:hypothetical protein